MENAGSACAREIYQRFPDSTAVILCGGGNNGGDGFVIARHLHNFGMLVSVVVLAETAKLKGDAKTNFGILERMDIPFRVVHSQWTEKEFYGCFPPGEEMLIVDAMLGTGVQGGLKEPYLSAVQFSNVASFRRVAIDVPTGLTGLGSGESVIFKADLTLTFVGLKQGFDEPTAKVYLGEIEVIEIGAPKVIYKKI